MTASRVLGVARGHPRGAGVVEELADGVFAYVQPDGGWFVNNCGFVLDHEGSLLIDHVATEARGRHLAEALDRHGAAPVKKLILTHHHGDHGWASGLLPDPVEVVAHAECLSHAGQEAVSREVLSAHLTPVDWGDLQPRTPDTGIASRLSLTTAGGAGSTPRAVEVIPLPHPAHTHGDLFVHLPDDGIVFAGDLLFNGVTPLLTEGDADGWLAALDTLEATGAHTAIPGHGPVGTLAMATPLRDYLQHVQAAAEDGIRTGRSPLEQARHFGHGPAVNWLDTERLVANLHRLYTAAGAQPPPPPGSVLADMVTLHGGRLPCHA